MRPGAAPAAGGADAARTLPEGVRRSHALEHLTGFLGRSEPLQVLDLGGINQPTLEFVTGLGHRLYAEHLVLAAEAAFPPASWFDSDFDPRAIEHYLEHALPFGNATAGAALVWDQLQFLPPPLAQAVVERLHRILRPEAPLLAFFHPESARGRDTLHTCRIIDDKHLLSAPRGTPRRFTPFSSRTIERFFQHFHSVKFFMTRDSVQEVVVRR